MDKRELIKIILYEKMKERGWELLYAAESGSRLWGMESTDSDWDVRFVYQRFLRDRLLRPTIDQSFSWMQDDMDFAGWDVAKTFHLAAKSNPSLIEWMQDPNPYFTTSLYAPLRDILLTSYDPRALGHHYGSMARSTFATWKMESEPPTLKGYTYVLRPLLMLMSLMADPYSYPLIRLPALIDRFDLGTMRHDIDLLLKMKAAATEDLRVPLPALQGWLHYRVSRTKEEAEKLPTRKMPVDDLEDLQITLLKAQLTANVL